MNWNDRPVLVTGGASFIGSHLVDALVDRGADVRVADDLSSGRIANIQDQVDSGRVEVVVGDLRDRAQVQQAVDGVDVVFHLAADHGGRGYVDGHQVACAGNLLLDSNVFSAAHEHGVDKIVYASSGCVYPNYIQADPSEMLLLTEDRVGPPYDADGMYGWAKLMGELTLKAMHAELGVRSVSCRYFTVYGPRGLENHAVMAMIARAYVGQDPFEVWGTGEQIRNWTHVTDIVEGTIAAAETIDDAEAINLGTTERIRVADAARQILEIAGRDIRLEFLPDMPTGPYNRVADNSRARELCDWEPRTSFANGIRSTLEWYFATKSVEEAKAALDHGLLAR